MTRTELRRWYWLKDELVDFAHLLGLRAKGNKRALMDRIAAHLHGHAFDEPTADAATGRRQLRAPVGADTIIPKGQRCSQLLRTWFADQIGSQFRFDAEMRRFFTATDGTMTLGDALSHWYATPDTHPRPIDGQFEYNHFTRDWYLRHPQGSRSELLSAWKLYNSTPVDQRAHLGTSMTSSSPSSPTNGRGAASP